MGDLKSVTLLRDCDAFMIPAGTPVNIPKGSSVVITQSFGGSYTVNINGNLARIPAEFADALGEEVVEQEGSGEKAAFKVVGDGSVDEAAIWEQIKTCYDPEIPVNIVELGLIYECNVSPIDPMKEKGCRVDVVMTLTAVGCGMGPVIADEVRAKVASVSNVAEVYVEVTFDPPWDQERMSEAARLQLGLL